MSSVDGFVLNRKIVYVRWLDHQEDDGSTNFEDEVGPAIFHTVGFLVGETEDWLEVARDLYMDGDEPIEKYKSLCILKRNILSTKDF